MLSQQIQVMILQPCTPMTCARLQAYLASCQCACLRWSTEVRVEQHNVQLLDLHQRAWALLELAMLHTFMLAACDCCAGYGSAWAGD